MSVIPPWSYSAISTFENCPRQYYHKYILKEKEPETDVTKHGTEVHKALEDRIKDQKPLPEAYQPYEKLAKSVEKAGLEGFIYTEMPLAIDKDFKPTGFFAKNVWGRGKADVVITRGPVAWVGDWKTGKVREKIFQVQVFAGFLFKMLPNIKTVFGNNIWLQAGKVGETYKFDRERGENVIWQEIIQKVQRIELAMEKNAFIEKPSGLCGFCAVKSCRFNRS